MWIPFEEEISGPGRNSSGFEPFLIFSPSDSGHIIIIRRRVKGFNNETICFYNLL
jgi:hypothetical protein